MEGLLWRLKEGEEEGGVHSPEALPPRSGVGSPGGRGGLRRRLAVVGVNANLDTPPSCATHTVPERMAALVYPSSVKRLDEACCRCYFCDASFKLESGRSTHHAVCPLCMSKAGYLFRVLELPVKPGRAGRGPDLNAPAHAPLWLPCTITTALSCGTKFGSAPSVPSRQQPPRVELRRSTMGRACSLHVLCKPGEEV